MMLISTPAFAISKDECQAFFNQYVNNSNSYSSALTTMYASNAKIIKQVAGTQRKETLTKTEYLKNLKLYSMIAKLRGYTNSYKNVNISADKDSCKVTSVRYPSLSKGKDAFKAYLIIGKDSSGNLKINEDFTEIKSDKL